jgi:hypothetical protein
VCAAFAHYAFSFKGTVRERTRQLVPIISVEFLNGVKYFIFQTIQSYMFDCAGGPVQLPVAERAPGRETQRARLHPGLRPLRGQP